MRWHGRARTEISIGRKTPTIYNGCRLHQTKLKIWTGLERLEIGIWNMAQSTSAVWSRSKVPFLFCIVFLYTNIEYEIRMNTSNEEGTHILLSYSVA